MLTAVNELVWGPAGVGLLAAAGLWLTLRTGWFQLVHLKLWLGKTLGAILTRQPELAQEGEGSISPLQSLCTALGATIGTGSIVGVAVALTSGGPGAIFWMWVMAFFGMMTSYAENLLGLRYRQQQDGLWHGGPMYYLTLGLGARPGCKTLGRVLAGLFALLCVLASFGGQRHRRQPGNRLSPAASGHRHGSGRRHRADSLARDARGGVHRRKAGAFHGGFLPAGRADGDCHPCVRPSGGAGSHPERSFWAAGRWRRGRRLRRRGGGAVGFYAGQLFQRGGSGFLCHRQRVRLHPGTGPAGHVGNFSGFCFHFPGLHHDGAGHAHIGSGGPAQMLTLSPAPDLAGEAFSSTFGALGPTFIAGAVLLFAWSSMLGWSQYGAECWSYLFGPGSLFAYRLAFLALIAAGANVEFSSAWSLSDTFNGLMMLPNLVGLLGLSGEVAQETRGYLSRHSRG